MESGETGRGDRRGVCGVQELVPGPLSSNMTRPGARHCSGHAFH